MHIRIIPQIKSIGGPISIGFNILLFVILLTVGNTHLLFWIVFAIGNAWYLYQLRVLYRKSKFYLTQIDASPETVTFRFAGWAKNLQRIPAETVFITVRDEVMTFNAVHPTRTIGLLQKAWLEHPADWETLQTQFKSWSEGYVPDSDSNASVR
jgi:hypothetical protein